jgi:SynChlorMet cassette protein ScmD
MNLSDKPVANPLIVLREEFDDWAILFNPDTAEAMGINATGVRIWKQINGARTVAQLISLVQDSYNHVPDTVDEEITGFLHNLMQKGFLAMEAAKTE